MTGRVLVLAGGLSHERDVSLRSGRRVAEALRDHGHEVELSDVDAGLLAKLSDRPTCVVPVLHGESGEDGTLREILELLRLPYVGAMPAACRLAFDKPVAKTIVSQAGLRTPHAVTLPAQSFRELGAAAVMNLLVEGVGLPLIVKPTKGGSALGCSLVRDETELPGAMVNAFAYGDVALVESFVAGYEVAVPVLEVDGVAQPMPSVGITADDGNYDYTARYTAGSTEFQVPAGLEESVALECALVAVTAHEALGLRDLSRSDLIVDSEGQVWFLEVNVAPGLTETSTVPLSLEAHGTDLGLVMGDLVRRAVERANTGTQ